MVIVALQSGGLVACSTSVPGCATPLWTTTVSGFLFGSPTVDSGPGRPLSVYVATTNGDILRVSAGGACVCVGRTAAIDIVIADVFVRVCRTYLQLQPTSASVIAGDCPSLWLALVHTQEQSRWLAEIAVIRRHAPMAVQLCCLGSREPTQCGTQCAYSCGTSLGSFSRPVMLG